MGFPFAEIVRARTLRWAGAAFLTLVFSGGFVVHSDSPKQPQIHTTRTAETRGITLEDGSAVHLNTRTRLESFSDAADRRVVIREGEAFFEVKSGAADQPLRIQVMSSEIQARDAHLNVYRRSNGEVSITVLEGTAKVTGFGKVGEPAWQRELHADQCMRYGLDGPIRDVRTTPFAQNVARWIEGTLVFADKPLPQVLHELERYTDWHIVVRDPRLNEMQVVATVKSNDVRAALTRLSKVAPVDVTEHDGTFLLSYRTSEPKNNRGR